MTNQLSFDRPTKCHVKSEKKVMLAGIEPEPLQSLAEYLPLSYETLYYIIITSLYED